MFCTGTGKTICPSIWLENWTPCFLTNYNDTSLNFHIWAHNIHFVPGEPSLPCDGRIVFRANELITLMILARWPNWSQTQVLQPNFNIYFVILEEAVYDMLPTLSWKIHEHFLQANIWCFTVSCKNMSMYWSQAAHSTKKWVYMIDCASNFYPLFMEIWAYFQKYPLYSNNSVPFSMDLQSIMYTSFIIDLAAMGTGKIS